MVQVALGPNTCSDILSVVTNDNIFPPKILPPPPTTKKRKVCHYLCIGTTKIWIETLLPPSVILALTIYSETIILMNSRHSFNHEVTGGLYFWSFIYFYVALQYHLYSFFSVVLRFSHNFLKWLLLLLTEYFTLFFVVVCLFLLKAIQYQPLNFWFFILLQWLYRYIEKKKRKCFKGKRQSILCSSYSKKIKKDPLVIQSKCENSLNFQWAIAIVRTLHW